MLLVGHSKEILGIAAWLPAVDVVYEGPGMVMEKEEITATVTAEIRPIIAAVLSSSTNSRVNIDQFIKLSNLDVYRMDTSYIWCV